MGRLHPAIRVVRPPAAPDDDPDLLLAEVDDLHPTAIESTGNGVRIFFASGDARDRARERLSRRGGGLVTAEDVDDENWAERSQAVLGPVPAGGLVIAPPWSVPDGRGRWITVVPSMGFGTGHHATTRLCLHWLQSPPPGPSARVIDVGTGSGVLAVAACVLGAARAVAIDADPDAVVSARDTVERNACADRVTVVESDLERLEAADVGGPFDLVLANLTGALLARHADRIVRLARETGRLILSGILVDEADGVVEAFGALGWAPAGRTSEDGWIGLALEQVTSPTSSTAR